MGEKQSNRDLVTLVAVGDPSVRVKICTTPSTSASYTIAFPSGDHIGLPWYAASVANGVNRSKCAAVSGIGSAHSAASAPATTIVPTAVQSCHRGRGGSIAAVTPDAV